MPRVDHFYITTDFDTLKSDDQDTAVVNIPASAGVAAGATATYSADINVGQAESLLAVMVNNSVDYPNGDYLPLSNAVRFDRTGSAAYSIVVRSSHISGNTVRLSCSIFNNGASPLTTSATAETFTFIVRSFRVPRFA